MQKELNSLQTCTALTEIAWMIARICRPSVPLGACHGALATIILVTAQAVEAQSNPDWQQFPDTAVVFTGQFNRIEMGLELLEQGKIEQLLISGVTEGSGVSVDRFDEQFELSSALIKARLQGRLELGARALTTLENAAETACWLQDRQDVQEILLITSTRHMERATLALQGMLPDVSIVGLAVQDPLSRTPEKDAKAEQTARAATRVLRFLPDSVVIAGDLVDCSGAEFH